MPEYLATYKVRTPGLVGRLLGGDVREEYQFEAETDEKAQELARDRGQFLTNNYGKAELTSLLEIRDITPTPAIAKPTPLTLYTLMGLSDSHFSAP